MSRRTRLASLVRDQSGPTLSLRDIRRSFNRGKPNELTVLDGANIDVWPGEAVALVGPSGSGKSTLLHIAGLLERPDKGDVVIADQDCRRLSEIQRTRVRRSDIGFVYQFHHLLAEFTALDNVVIPQMIAGDKRTDALNVGRQLLGRMGLEARLKHQPGQLSGGEQQRVAIARALANRPRLLLADEPTGNLDPKTASAVFEGLLEIVRADGLAALIATHNIDLAEQMDRIVLVKEGQLFEVQYSEDGEEAFAVKIEAAPA